jgi:hypothetical protein
MEVSLQGSFEIRPRLSLLEKCCPMLAKTDKNLTQSHATLLFLFLIL